MVEFSFIKTGHIETKSQTRAHLFGLGSPIGVRFLSCLGIVLRMRIWETLLDLCAGCEEELDSRSPI